MSRLKAGIALPLGVMLVAAAPALAQQDALCGGAGRTGQWIGGTEQGSDLSTASAALEQMALVLMQNEYVALFKLSEPAEVRVEAQGRGGGDPLIELRDAAGAVLLSDDDSGGDTASRGEIALEPGTYCLSMNSFDGAPMTGFVRIGRADHEPLTAGIDPNAAPPDDFGAEDGLGSEPDGSACEDGSNRIGNGPLDSSLGDGVAVSAAANEVAGWGFSLEQPAAISITAQNPNADPLITLFDAQGGFVAENDDFDGLDSRLDMISPLAAGEYCLAVTALSDPAQPITVTVSSYDPAAAMKAMIERGDASPPLDGSYPVTALGELGTRLRQDVQTTEATVWYSFDIGERGLVLVEAVSNGAGDPTLVLFDDFGRLIERNDDFGQSLDSRIAARVSPGTYLVGVRQLGDGQQALVRLLFERYVPAQ